MASLDVNVLSYSDELESLAVLKQLNEQRLTSCFCDIVLKVCGDNIFAHSNVLAAASPYFCSFLGKGQDSPRAFSQKIPQIIEIHIDGNDGTVAYGEAVRKVVDYMYIGKIDLHSGVIAQVMEIAKIMQMDSVLKFCSLFHRGQDDSSENTFENKKTTSEISTQTPKPAIQVPRVPLKDEPNSTEKIVNLKNQEDVSNGDSFHEQKEETHKSEKKVPELVKNVPTVSKGRRNRKQIHFGTKSDDSEIEIHHLSECQTSDNELKNETDPDIENQDNESENTQGRKLKRKRKLTMKMKALQRSSSKIGKSSELLTRVISDGDDPVKREKNYVCPECPYSTDTKYHFDRHFQAHELAVKRYSCDECDFSSSKLRELTRHKDEHLHAKFRCSICLYQAESEEKFSEHLLRHTGPQPYFCHTCDATFSNKTKLQLHLPKHSVDQPYVCKLCDRGFKWKHALKNHMITHSNAKDHLCDVCGFATAHKSQLKAHKLIHTGETYKCPDCSFQATKKQNLKYHMLTHTHEKPHQCEVCGQSFSLNKNMKRHMLLHSNERPYKCDQCSFSAVRNDKLKEHQLKQHGIGDSPKRRHRLSDYYNSTVPAEDNRNAHLQVQSCIKEVGVQHLEVHHVHLEDPVHPCTNEVVGETETHVIIDGEQNIPVTLNQISGGGVQEMTYQFVTAFENA